MSTFFQKITMRKELKKLNEVIDLKIIKGLPYKAEARRHKFLASQFYITNGRQQKSMFRKMSHVLASFVL